MREEFERRIVRALASFTLPQFTDSELSRSMREFSELYQLGAEGFARRFAPRVYAQSGNAVRLVILSRPRTVVMGRALYFKLRRGSEELYFNYGAYNPPFDQN